MVKEFHINMETCEESNNPKCQQLPIEDLNNNNNNNMQPVSIDNMQSVRKSLTCGDGATSKKRVNDLANCASLSFSKPHDYQDKALLGTEGNNARDSKDELKLTKEENGRERLKRHRIEVAGSVWIPDIWGQEELLKDWIDCSGFDACLAPKGIMSARQALIHEAKRANSTGFRIVNRC